MWLNKWVHKLFLQCRSRSFFNFKPVSVIVYQFQTVRFIQMMSLTFGLFTQVSGSGPLGPLVFSDFDNFCSLFESINRLSCLSVCLSFCLSTIPNDFSSETPGCCIWNRSRSTQGHHLSNLVSTLVPNATYHVSSVSWFWKRRFMKVFYHKWMWWLYWKLLDAVYEIGHGQPKVIIWAVLLVLW